ncbi:hypothetical protein BU24DRAFT_456312 [Aaosphaeria arxii CBS 175.79]|uniref:Uncharacterized protein n=1 Tax=Aaosphaeria arxii CBS 175.79 TaxID=1450172 RepID=A0A6A5X6G9_9PLEO|nr:uncharacterized protein BU24DRAFT_456312 [Aaosphaeria arxii CBS 175.79]KAF2008543.1 hypothetical protein BU24DRAFT_456312 [Aaosphaeria arxii CBS 175.79]
MTLQKKISALLAFAPMCIAKFQYTYHGIALDGVQACIANSDFTPINITFEGSCRPAFECVMRNIPNQRQSILSSGSAILGFIPTVLLLLGNTNEDIIRISARFPFLALCLSITNVNKKSGRHRNVPATRSGPFPLGPYGFVPDSMSTPILWGNYIPVVLVHILAATGATVVVWQTVDLGRKAVVTWACWTDHYPVIWICLAVIHHLIAVVFLRTSLRISGKSPSGKDLVPRSGLSVWNLVQENREIELVHRKLMRWSKASADLLNNLNLLYGTAVLSSLTLVSGRNAIIVLTVYGTIAAFSRAMAMWVLGTLDELE